MKTGRAMAIGEELAAIILGVGTAFNFIWLLDEIANLLLR